MRRRIRNKLYNTDQWIHNPSRVYPFTRCYERITDKGIHLKVDYQPAKKLSRLSVKRQGSERELCSIIKNGEIIREFDSVTEQDIVFSTVIRPYKAIFNTVPNNYVLSILGGVYGLELQTKYQGSQVYIPSWLRKQFPKTYKEWLQLKIREFWRDIKRKKPKIPLWRRILKRIWGDIFDFSLALALSVMLYVKYWDLSLVGFYLAAFGILTGFNDWLIRRRNPLFIKIFFITIPAGYLYLYGYMYQ